jgi:hypothetical protein
MSATENVRLRSWEHRVPLLAVRLLLGLTECQDPQPVGPVGTCRQPVVPQLSSARPDKRKDLEGLFACRIFRECRQVRSNSVTSRKANDPGVIAITSHKRTMLE